MLVMVIKVEIQMTNLKRPKQTLPENLKPSVLVMIKTVDMLYVLFGFSSYFVIFLTE